ncbi:hypothetical protein GUITHDRAFT_121681 [Guillardia theta CCMP2712]|uniref:Uncharacterized protein n=1 Tax=Guillardia theta (strain CCMP2712) TaxID=905079 RepID=L1I7B9_GUITC|nr:hypothetical protein GUITHDRAFT_121681 [Guillardia theta CCMP2712]EKX32148.1 hypothetical protein GUITHDRAFT_121681 [Guillardia theta CCMP2712]|eukprot:XP_005819128.1 hypothetical protein GUITHDRAFT_121681 [Guillardia theta CCMP2712]
MGWPDRVLARHWEFGFSIMADKMEKLRLGTRPILPRQPELRLGHLHPSTGKRAHVFVSSEPHAEEALARIANRELSLISTEFAFFCYVMFSTWSFAVRPGQPMVLLLPQCACDAIKMRPKENSPS